MRELAVQSINSTNTAGDRGSLDAEFQALVTEIDRIATDTQFNSQNILDGSFSGGATFQVGANAGQTISVTIADATATGATLGLAATLAVDTSGNADTALADIDAAITGVDSLRGDLGAVQSRLESTIANLSNVSENVSAARSRILDADIAAETSALTKASILQQAGVSVLAQANQMPQLALSLLGV
jgi:flagellin